MINEVTNEQTVKYIRIDKNNDIHFVKKISFDLEIKAPVKSNKNTGILRFKK